MDYSLAALKLLCVQLRSARLTTSQTAYTFGGILFQRAWVQGVIVSKSSSDDGGGGDRYLLDDGTGVIELFLSSDFSDRAWEAGCYVMVVGAYVLRPDLPIIKVHKLLDLSPFPDREPMWYLEVMEVFKLFYQGRRNHMW